MSMDVNDLLSSLLDDQARVNAAVDDSDINNLVADSQQVSGETIGLTETVNAVTAGVSGLPHNWDDGHSMWNFFTWA